MIPEYEQYTPNTWVNGESIANERNMNHIEGGINAVGSALSGLLTAINNGEIGGSGGNADTVDGSHAWQMQTLNYANGTTHGSERYILTCRHNVDKDNRFRMQITKSDGTAEDTNEVSVDAALKIREFRYANGTDLSTELPKLGIGKYNIRCMNTSFAPTNYGLSPTGNDLFYEVTVLNSVWIKVVARNLGSNDTFTRSLINGTWTRWTREGDGCNADTALKIRELDYAAGTELGAELVKLGQGKYNIRCMNTSFAPVNYGVNPASNDFFYEVTVLNNLWIKVVARDLWTNNSFERNLINDVWCEWKRSNSVVLVQSTQPTSPIVGDLWIW